MTLVRHDEAGFAFVEEQLLVEPAAVGHTARVERAGLALSRLIIDAAPRNRVYAEHVAVYGRTLG